MVWLGGPLRVQPFDVATLEPSGELRQVVQGDDVLAYPPGSFTWPGQLHLYDRAGNRLRSIGRNADYYGPRLSQDGSRVVVDVGGSRS